MAKTTTTATDPVPVADPQPYADLPIEVYERRLLDPDPIGSTPIELKTPGSWTCRWINTGQDGRWSMVVHRLGYVPVKVSELVDPRMVTGLVTSPDGMVTRGDRGQEVLVKMPKEYFERIKLAQAERLKGRMQSEQAQKETLQHALGAKFGDEAASAVREFKGSVLEGVERMGPEER